MAATTTTSDAAIEAAIDIQPVTEPERERKFVTFLMPRQQRYDEGPEDDRINMDFGPSDKYSEEHDATNIKFNEREPGGPGIAIVPEDHPAIPALLQRYPDVQIVEPETNRTFICEVCGKDFRKADTLLIHKRSH